MEDGWDAGWNGDVVGKSGVGMVFELSWWVVWKGGMEGRMGGGEMAVRVLGRENAGCRVWGFGAWIDDGWLCCGWI